MTSRCSKLAVCLVLGCTWTVSDAAEFFAGDTLISEQERAILGVSDDGSVAAGRAFVVGQSLDADVGDVAYRWTTDGGFQTLGRLSVADVLGGFADSSTSTWSHSSNARALSGDGTTVVGNSTVGFDLAKGRDWASQAFRWTEPTGMVPIGVLPGHNYSEALDVSRDGSVIVGFSERVDAAVTRDVAPYFLETLALTPYRWTVADGLVELTLPDGIDRAMATDVSADGKVVAGVLQPNDVASSRAFRWTEETGIQPLTEGTQSLVWEVSEDGSVVVGQLWNGDNPSVTQAFRWTLESGAQPLGNMLNASGSTANAVSADGSIVLGSYETDTGYSAFVWNEDQQMRDLQDVLVNEYGLSEALEGWQLNSVRGLSADARVIHGVGETPEGLLDDWIVYLDTPLLSQSIPGDFDFNGLIDVADIDLLVDAVRNLSTDPKFDLDDSGTTDSSDLDRMILDVLNTYFGDANLDGEFNSRDIVTVFQAGTYEDDVPQNATWSSGDWNADGDFTTGDLVTAFSQGGYEQGPRAATQIAAVPEPASGAMLLWLVPLLLRLPNKSL